MSKIFENEYLVKAWEGCVKSRNMAITHYTISTSGKFFIATKTGLLVDTSSNLNMQADYDVAKSVDDHIIRRGWQDLHVEEIARRLSDRLAQIDAEGVFDFTELEIKLLEKFSGAEDGIEEAKALERPVPTKPFILA